MSELGAHYPNWFPWQLVVLHRFHLYYCIVEPNTVMMQEVPVPKRPKPAAGKRKSAAPTAVVYKELVANYYQSIGVQ